MTPNQEKRLETILWVLLSLLLGGIVTLSLVGCGSTSCPPRDEAPLDTISVFEPTACIVAVAPLPEINLPAYPPVPQAGADEEVWKAWALEVGRVVREREALLEAQVSAYQKKIAEHNALTPKCAQ